MALDIAQLFTLGTVEKVIIHSLDLSLYQVSVEVEGQEHFITDNTGKMLRSFNILDIQAQIRGIEYQKMVLRQSSAYDEMIGFTTDSGNNTLEVELQDNHLS